MSFSPRNVSQLIVGETTTANAGAYATQVGLGTVGAYLIKKLPSGGGSGTLANKAVGISAVTATGGQAVSEYVTVANIKSMVNKTLAAGTAKVVTATYTAPSDFLDKTFWLTVDMHDHIGSMLNDRFISAYVACDAAGKFTNSSGALVTGTINDVCTELRTQLTATFKLSGREFTVGGSTNAITITQVKPKQVLGVLDGIALPFDVTAGYKYGSFDGGNYQTVSAAVVVTTADKIDDLVQLKNMEWFISGYSKDAYREMGYPASFPSVSNITAAGVALGDKALFIEYYTERDATNIERQHRQLIVVGAAATEFETAVKAVVA